MRPSSDSHSPRGAEEARLHVVTGKGGTGKTTVAAALAFSLAAGDRRVLLCEVEGRQGIASLFDTVSTPYEEHPVASGPQGGEIYALEIDAEQALLEYLSMFYHLGRAGRILNRFGVIDFATTIAPGVRDVLVIGKAYEAVRRRSGDRPAYDAVVLDAPPTGRIGRFLNVNTEVAGIAKAGPIRRQATSIMRLLKSPRTAVHVVATPEDMPVQEALDCIVELEGLGLSIGMVIDNMLRPSEMTSQERADALEDQLDRSRIAASLSKGGLPDDASVVDGLTAQARDHAQRLELEDAHRVRLEATGKPLAELTYVPEGIDLPVLHEFSDTLSEARTDAG